MIRSLSPDEPELVKLCRCRNWGALCQRSQSHPFEASPPEAAIRGHGTTVLSLAIRMGAPKSVIHALLQASFQQIEVVRQGSTILIEALRHRASDEVLDYLVQAVLHHKATIQHKSDLLGFRDELGRTALHHMVERTKLAFAEGVVNRNNWEAFRNIVQGRPETAHTLDSDGNTPLVLLLLLPKVQRAECQFAVEEEIFRMVHLMVSVSPWVGAMSRLLPEPWHDSRHATMDGSPTPLYYAILHGRSASTINILIDANRNVGVNPCAARISQYSEVPLHTAICTQASLPVVARVLEACPESALRADAYGLTPIDWMWIRHVVGWHTDNTPTTLASRGRYLSRQFSEWHEDVSRSLLPSCEAVGQPRLRVPLKRVTKDLVGLMRLLLPEAAAIAVPKTTCKNWSLLSAACLVPSPLAMISLALDQSDSRDLQTPDAQYQRLPLHWAVARLGYAGNFPVGFTQQTQRLVEPTAVPLLVSSFAAACDVADGRGQLPLHIALDAAQHYREVAFTLPERQRLRPQEIDTMEDEAINVLVTTFPESLERRDGKSGLLPFQQAAIGPGARLNTIYVLLRQLPSLLSGEGVDALSLPMEI